MKTKYFKTPGEWREWLKNNHDKEDEMWLVFYKKETGQPSIDYESAVEEALCFGWIDSIIRKIDESKYVRKFTQRKDNSKWSELNKKRIKRLIGNDRMASPGLAKVNIAKQNGCWDKTDRIDIDFDKIPEEFKIALRENSKAKAHFDNLANSYQKQYIGWIATAKRTETRERRIKESIRLLEMGQKLGLK